MKVILLEIRLYIFHNVARDMCTLHYIRRGKAPIHYIRHFPLSWVGFLRPYLMARALFVDPFQEERGNNRVDRFEGD